MQQALETHTLETAYKKACRQVELVCEAENARQLRLQTLLLEDENDELHTQLARGDERIDELEQYVLDLQEDVEATVGNLDIVQSNLRVKNREIETLKAKLNSLSGATMDSTKLLTEKLTLERELSTLKPELDHLRSQASSYQSLLAEKLSLQRQLSILQVEMENEKRSTQRLAAKEGKSHAEDGKLEARLEALQAELAKEKREKQNADREALKASTLFENKMTMYESRLDAFRGKLKVTKEALKDAQAELQRSQAANVRAATSAVTSAPVARIARKRAASEMDAHTMIGTPGDLPAARKSKVKSTWPGEKSTFSITPFLNRTASVAPESPQQDGDKSNDDEEPQTEPQSPSRPSNARESSQSAVRETIEKTISEDEGHLGKKPASLMPERSKKSTARALPRRATAVPKLAQVAEEETDPPAALKEVASKVVDNNAVAEEIVDDGPEKKKIKRKMLGGGLGKTLFDEDEGDALNGNRRMGAVRGFGTLARGGLGGPELGAGGFGEFSPLKKDRRAGAA